MSWIVFEISGLLLHLENKKDSMETDSGGESRQSPGLRVEDKMKEAHGTATDKCCIIDTCSSAGKCSRENTSYVKQSKKKTQQQKSLLDREAVREKKMYVKSHQPHTKDKVKQESRPF